MKQVLIATAAGLLLVVAGCSQLYGARSGMVGDAEASAGRALAPAVTPHGENRGAGAGAGQGAARGHPDAALDHGRDRLMDGDGGIPDLTEAQRAQLAAIRKDFHRRQWALMERMREHGGQLAGAMRVGEPMDELAARQAYDARAAIRKQMFENSLEARKRIHGLLTPQQRELLRPRRQALRIPTPV